MLENQLILQVSAVLLFNNNKHTYLKIISRNNYVD